MKTENKSRYAGPGAHVVALKSMFIIALYNPVWYRLGTGTERHRLRLMRAEYRRWFQRHRATGARRLARRSERDAEKGWARAARVRRAYGSSAIEITTQLSCLTDGTCVTKRNERRLQTILRATISCGFCLRMRALGVAQSGPTGRTRHTLVKRKYRFNLYRRLF